MKKNKRLTKILSVTLSAFVLLYLLSSLLAIGVKGSNDCDVDIYYKKENSYMKIALTFDDGPHPRYTSQILDVLDQYNIKATFFVVGVNAKYYSDTLESVIKRGHEIGNHTYTHPHVSCLNTGTLTQEVEGCESTI